MIPLERNLYGHPSAGLHWEKVPSCEFVYYHRRAQLFFSVYVDDEKRGWAQSQLRPDVVNIFQENCFRWPQTAHHPCLHMLQAT